jgi:hypothetical protein
LRDILNNLPAKLLKIYLLAKFRKLIIVEPAASLICYSLDISKFMEIKKFAKEILREAWQTFTFSKYYITFRKFFSNFLTMIL